MKSRINLQNAIPSEVASLILDDGLTPAIAWREYLQLTEKECAQKIGLSQAAYSLLENSDTSRKTTRIKLATALGINPEQLDC